MMGSVVFAGEYPLEQALAAKDRDGVTLMKHCAKLAIKVNVSLAIWR
jgi:N-carbamoyl-L-amino-acid hydrolase